MGLNLSASSENYDIAIIGAGPIGLFCAYCAINAGLKTIIVTLPIENAKTAGIAAGGMIAPAYEFFEHNDEKLCEFAIKARQEWDIFTKYTFCEIAKEALALASSKTEIARLEKIKKNASKFGFDFKYIETPFFLNSKIALKMDCDALINPNKIMNFLHDFILKNDGKIVFDEVTAFENNEIIGVKSKYRANKTIIANGIEAKKFISHFEIVSQLYPVRGQTIEIDFAPKFVGSIRYNSTYLMARENKIIIGATSQDNIDDWSINDKDGEFLLKSAISIFPDLDNAKILRSFCGIRPKAKNEFPIIGAYENENIYFAIGAYRNGWAFAPFVARLIIEEITQISKIPSFLLPFGK